MLFLNKFSSKAKFACFSRLKHFVPHILFHGLLLKKNATKTPVSTQFISFAQILRLFLQFCGFCVLVCNSVSFAMFNFCSSHSVSMTCYLKNVTTTAFQRILQLQYKFFYLICSFLRICVGVGCIFEAISALKLRCLWWTRTFLQKNVIPECGLFV